MSSEPSAKEQPDKPLPEGSSGDSPEEKGDSPKGKIEEATSSKEELEESKAAPDPEDLGVVLPEDSSEAITLLLKELATARSDATSYLDDLQRVAADFANFRSRSNREQRMTREMAAERVVTALLPVIDSLDEALKSKTHTDAEAKILSGVKSIRDQLIEVLEKEGLESVKSMGSPFDPEVHEAILSKGDGELVVTQVLRRGYKLKGRVIRAALVGLEGKGSSETKDGAPSEKKKDSGHKSDGDKEGLADNKSGSEKGKKHGDASDPETSGEQESTDA